MEENKIINAPSGKERLKWLGPAFIWMLSAAGSGELLFTPRIASQYGYTLIWALVLAVLMKWFINREIGRYTVCTGATFFQGLTSISEKSRVLLWLIVVPQLIVAVATMAGLAGAAITSLITIFDIHPVGLVIGVLAFTTTIIYLGQYKAIEKITTILAIIISLTVLTAAISAGPNLDAMAKGFIPKPSDNLKFDEILPWLGFMLAGAAGLMWFSYWTAARGYGAAAAGIDEGIDAMRLNMEKKQQLKEWIKHMTIANTLAVVGALVVAFSFLILGTELLQPKGLIPEENKIAATLGQLLAGIWGQAGFWFMIIAVFIIFLSTILADQDGFGRMFTDGIRLLIGKPGSDIKWLNKNSLQKLFVIALGVFPAIAYIIVGEPVGLLKIAGVIEACHIPIVTALILYLNHKKLPKELKPSKFSFIGTCIAGITFTTFAFIYIYQLFSA